MKNPSSVEEAVRLYCAAWNAASAKEIADLLIQCWTDQSTYIDPQNPMVTGPEQLAELILESYEMLPGRIITQTSEADHHDGSGRFVWQQVRPGNEPGPGMDYFEYNEQNRITRIVGFLANYL